MAPEPTERHVQIRLEARALCSPAARSHFAIWPQWGVDGVRMDLYVRWLGLPPGTRTPPRLFLHYRGDQHAPAAALVASREVVRFAARGTDSFGNAVVAPSVSWSLADSSVGQIDTRGVFTAGSVAALSANGTAASRQPFACAPSRG